MPPTYNSVGCRLLAEIARADRQNESHINCISPVGKKMTATDYPPTQHNPVFAFSVSRSGKRRQERLQFVYVFYLLPPLCLRSSSLGHLYSRPSSACGAVAPRLRPSRPRLIWFRPLPNIGRAARLDTAVIILSGQQVLSRRGGVPLLVASAGLRVGLILSYL